MAQLESGKKYIVENTGIKNYTSEPLYHTIPEYFTWLSEKIATGLGIEMQPIIKDNKYCYLPLPYINDPTENRLCLYLTGNTLSTSLEPKISYFNGDNYYNIGTPLPRIMYSNQSKAIKYKNSSTYTYYASNSEFLNPSDTGSFVIDTRFLESNGFYTIAFLSNTTDEIDDIIISPKVFICDMIDVLTEKHYDGVFILSNANNGYAGNRGWVSNSSSFFPLMTMPSIAAIGINKNEEYSLQGYVPQVFTSDYSTYPNSSSEKIISASMIKVQFGRLKAAYDIYLTIGNATENLIEYCNVDNIKNNYIDWYKDALKINNKKYNLSCNCSKIVFDFANPQWAIAIEDKGEVKPKVKGYLKFSSDEDFTLSVANNPEWEKMEYSLNNGKTWAEWNGKVLSGDKNKSIYIRGTNNKILTKSKDYGYNSCHWSFTGKYIDGNIETLLDYKKVKKGEHPSMEQRCCSSMFSQCTSLERAPKLSATTLAPYCYYYMFNKCTSLKEAPELPAIKMEEHCYNSMFKDCTSLKEVPDLPATTLATCCYRDMFTRCTSLTKTHNVLPATKLEEGCYWSLYYNCTSLVEISENLLPATTLAKNCYRSMFSECTSLTKVTKLPATTLAIFCYYYMFNNTKVTQVPKLPATKLIQSCYDHMFSYCSELEISATKNNKYKYDFRIPTSGTGTNATYATNAMFYGIKSTPVTNPSINTTYYVEKEPV